MVNLYKLAAAMHEEDEIYLNYLTSAPDEDEELCNQMNDFLDHSTQPIEARVLDHLERVYDQFVTAFDKELLAFYHQQQEDLELANVSIGEKKELSKEELLQALSRNDLTTIFIALLTGECVGMWHMKYKQYFIIELHYRDKKQRLIDCRL